MKACPFCVVAMNATRSRARGAGSLDLWYKNAVIYSLNVAMPAEFERGRILISSTMTRRDESAEGRVQLGPVEGVVIEPA